MPKGKGGVLVRLIGMGVPAPALLCVERPEKARFLLVLGLGFLERRRGGLCLRRRVILPLARDREAGSYRYGGVRRFASSVS